MGLTKSNLTSSQLEALKVMERGGMALSVDAKDLEHLINLGVAKQMLGGPVITAVGRQLLRSDR
ncbi:hypothetical protein MesoLj113a_47170 [Mesorhizobium sp. 113-1-2]|nr:Uncharacterized protein MLTONO_0297 [Mesorhizobium loti]BCG73559.1 hypothetical protein MesoLj113a_47170 [Mesorhizobium sp. 113-1-2]